MCCTSHLEDFIKQLYLKINITQSHQLDMRVIAERLNIQLYYWDNSSRALFLKRTAYIFLDERITDQQQWQDFYHELSHVLTHSGHQGRLPLMFIEYQEWKANNFMYHACIPSFMLDELSINDYSYPTVRKVTKLFGVEYDFALRRLTQYIQNKQFMQSLHGKQLHHL